MNRATTASMAIPMTVNDKPMISHDVSRVNGEHGATPGVLLIKPMQRLPTRRAGSERVENTQAHGKAIRSIAPVDPGRLRSMMAGNDEKEGREMMLLARRICAQRQFPNLGIYL